MFNVYKDLFMMAENESDMMLSEKRKLVIKWYNMMPIMKKCMKKTPKANRPKCQWPLVGGITRVKKQKNKPKNPNQKISLYFSRLLK